MFLRAPGSQLYPFRTVTLYFFLGVDWMKVSSMKLSMMRLLSISAAALWLLPRPDHNGPDSDLAATPPMGGTAGTTSIGMWTCTIRAQAEGMVSERDAGCRYTYINIDDTWEGERDVKGNIQTNNKFPDMKAAWISFITGLKLGDLPSPGAKTCAKFERQSRARGAGRPELRGVGHRLSEV